MAAEGDAEVGRDPSAAEGPIGDSSTREGRLTPQQLYDGAAEQVNRLVRRLVGPDPDQDDLVNEAFLRMLRNLDQLRDPSRFHGWVAKVTVSVVHDWLRKRKVRNRYHVAHRNFDSMTGSKADADDLYLAIRTLGVLDLLTVKQRLAFSIRHFEKLPLPQVAELCDCSLATIKRRLAKAEKKFYTIAGRDPLLSELLARGQRNAEDGR